MTRSLRRWLVVLVAAYAAWPSSGRAYVWSGNKWPTRRVPYYINPANNDVSEAAAISAIQEGAATWTQQSNADFAFYYVGQTSGSSFVNNGKNEVFFRNSTNGSLVAETMRWFDGAGNLLDADIAFYDAGWQFFTGTSGCSGGVYVEDFAAHEFGHALGLKHSDVTTATMYPTGVNCSTSWRILDPDDLAGVEAVYPATGSNSQPTVNITAPASGTSVPQGTSVTFTGSASDREDGNVSSRITWRSNIDGTLGTGASVSRALSNGTHTVTANVVDSAGATASSQVTVYVTASANTAPTLTISSPANNASTVQGSPLTFSGSASDSQDGNLTSYMVWSSNLDGQLGTGSGFSRYLSTGTHTITAAVTDSAGASTAKTETVTVTAYVNALPTVAISSPANNATVAAGATVTFSGTASDKEDGTLTSRLSWQSNLDGPLGIGSGFTHTLSAGTHTVTAEVSDSSGATGLQRVTVYVSAATPPSGSIWLRVSGTKVKGSPRADLTWGGSAATSIDVYRNGLRVMTTVNDGSQSDNIAKKGGGTYTYTVCEAGTSVCSPAVAVVF
jgi:molybdopterin synthase catalytic subunit